MADAADLPSAIHQAIEERLGVRIAHVQRLSGGDVNTAARLDLAEGDSLFAKWQAVTPVGLFEAEADGLQALAEPGVIRIPAVRLVSSDPAFLVLEYLVSTTPRDPDAFSRRFAAALAAMHHLTTGTTYGYTRDNYLGSQFQRNTPPGARWSDFYRDYRLTPQIERAVRGGKLPPDRERELRNLLDRLPVLLDGLPVESSLIHGDLWSGNFLCGAGDEPALIDPAVYRAPREMEMAYVELFGGFPPNFVRHYQTIYPLDGGYGRRRTLHQLYPLLIHLNHFGETYGPAIDRVCAEYR